MSNTLAYVAVLLSVTAGFAYFNHHLLRLPRNSGLLVIALIASLILRGVEALFPSVELATLLRHALGQINFGAALLNGFLAFLLFAAALDVEPRALIDRKWTISALATIGVLISTFAIAAGLFFIFRFVGIEVPLAYCLVFGALISPTDPVTVTGALERLPIPRGLQAVIAGESLFNDGIGIVLYSIFLQLAAQPAESMSSILVGSIAFARETGGGILLGLAGGGFALLAMRGIDEYNIELMISLALVTGIYAVAETIGVSGPVAVVTTGLLMGSIGVKYAVSGTTQDYLQKFWSLTDEVLNSLLFLLIGLEFAALDLHWAYIAAAGLAIPLSLVVRGLSIALASLPLNLGAEHKVRSISLLTWSGLRGGISVALALSLPDSPYREALLTACYGIAVFTMIVQGLTLHRLAARLYPGMDREGAAARADQLSPR
jgi:CPA1 family monovalent cation:H+ antiporter